MIECPNCHQSYYTTHYTITTAVGWEPIYKDGKLINSNPNYSTETCTCCVCHHNFTITTHNGEVEIKDLGLQEAAPTMTVEQKESIKIN